jgi:hypothetical protein
MTEVLHVVDVERSPLALPRRLCHGEKRERRDRRDRGAEERRERGRAASQNTTRAPIDARMTSEFRPSAQPGSEGSSLRFTK